MGIVATTAMAMAIHQGKRIAIILYALIEASYTMTMMLHRIVPLCGGPVDMGMHVHGNSGSRIPLDVIQNFDSVPKVHSGVCTP